MIRKYVMVSVIAFLFVISFIGCTTMPVSQQKEVVKYVANFNYTPAALETANSAGVTFAVASVNYQSNSGTLWLTWPQFSNLDTAIKKDLTKLLEAKGITLRGPFDSYDLIPYQDKKASDIYAVPTLELSVTAPGGWAMPFKVSGKFTLLLKEIMTGELMWSKTIPLTSFDFRLVGGLGVNPKDDRLITDLEVRNRNDVAKGIEKQYPEFIATILKLIDPEEMRMLKKQCQEIRSKKGY